MDEISERLRRAEEALAELNAQLSALLKWQEAQKRLKLAGKDYVYCPHCGRIA